VVPKSAMSLSIRIRGATLLLEAAICSEGIGGSVVIRDNNGPSATTTNNRDSNLFPPLRNKP